METKADLQRKTSLHQDEPSHSCIAGCAK